MSRVSFAIGTGRSGTTFLYKVLEKEPEVASSHEKHPLSDSFHRYCKWYNLPVDHAGFLSNKEKGIKEDLLSHKYSFESSAYLSLSIEELYNRFNSKFILLVRSPEKVVDSYLTKGWYENEVIIEDPNKIPSYQESKLFHHFLGRTLPKGVELDRWRTLSRRGKLAWFWNTLNKKVLEQFTIIPESNKMIVRLEDLNFSKYLKIAEFIGLKSNLNKDEFNSIVRSKPNAYSNNPTVNDWSEIEISHFEGEVIEMAKEFGYQYKIEKLQSLITGKERIKIIASESSLIQDRPSHTVGNENVTVIIRSVGERTEGYCKSLLEKQVPVENIFIVHEVPFSASMRKSFEIGIEQNRKYTLCIDADVLVTNNAVEVLVKHAEEQDEKVCEVQAQVLDKFTGKARAAGNHLYRTSLLQEVLKRIPVEGVDIRPEYHTLCKMKEDGFPWVEFSDVIGLHDYEQSYKDIFRKTFIYAHKFSQFLPMLVEYWREKSKNDSDYVVALWGLSAGIAVTDDIRININKYPKKIYNFYNEDKLQEKEDLIDSNFLYSVEDVIDQFISGGAESLESNNDEIEAIEKNYLEKMGFILRHYHRLDLLRYTLKIARQKLFNK